MWGKPQHRQAIKLLPSLNLTNGYDNTLRSDSDSAKSLGIGEDERNWWIPLTFVDPFDLLAETIIINDKFCTTNIGTKVKDKVS